MFLMENARKLQAEGVPRAEILAAANWAIVENMARSRCGTRSSCRPIASCCCTVRPCCPSRCRWPSPHRLQSHVRGRAFALVPLNPGHRACFGLIRTQQQTAPAGAGADRSAPPDRHAASTSASPCAAAPPAATRAQAATGQAHLSRRRRRQDVLVHARRLQCVNELLARKKLGIAPEAVRDTYKEIWDFVDQRHPRSDAIRAAW
ncbi:MAG: hypothetical protein MZW92_00085 [Comamonadaceae bacterium]|nr:hypothetical protein [Comamonadaceae bacterium]